MVAISPVGRASVGAVIALLAALALPQQAHATSAPMITFGIEPAAGPGDTRSSLSYGLAPGASTTDRVAVVNFSGQALALDVYGADASGGVADFTLAARNAAPSEVGSWLTVDGKQAVHITVPARHVDVHGTRAPGRTLLPVRLSVAQHTQPGAYAGGVVVSLASSAGSRVTLQQRVALRVYVTVPASSAPSASAADLAARPAAAEHNSSTSVPTWAVVVLVILLCVALSCAGRFANARRKKP